MCDKHCFKGRMSSLVARIPALHLGMEPYHCGLAKASDEMLLVVTIAVYGPQVTCRFLSS
jgi:hypothetical protein